MGLQLLDERLNKHLQPLAVVLMYEDRFGLLPELFDIFGEESLIKFLDIFAGKTFTVPDRDAVDRRIRDVRIWMALAAASADPQVRVADVTKELAREYGLAEKSVQECSRRVKSYMEAFSIRVNADG